MLARWWTVLVMGTLGLAPVLVSAREDGPPLPQYAADRHLGVAGCAGGQCHGRIAPTDRNVRLDEATIWRDEDRHAQAYQTLLTEQSRRIARSLGIGAAHEADMCLDCHADNVAEDKRERRFQIEDGVGCEACHGGGERYRDTHTDKSASHADNLAQGLYPTDNRIARARLCLSCHLGTRDKLATHRIMGAGHPRLRFDMEKFEVEQPYHYDLDDDYVERKGEPDSLRNWVVGLAMASKATLELIQSEHFTGPGIFPDPALFECNACHHPMPSRQWRLHDATAGLGPGAVRLADGNFLLLAAAADVLSPAEGKALRSQLAALHNATRESRESVVEASRTLIGTVDALVARMDDALPSDEQVRRVLGNVLSRAARGMYHDRSTAELATYAVDVLLFVLGENDAQAARMARLYELSGARTRKPDETGPFDPDRLGYDPTGFASAMGDLKRVMGV